MRAGGLKGGPLTARWRLGGAARLAVVPLSASSQVAMELGICRGDAAARKGAHFEREWDGLNLAHCVGFLVYSRLGKRSLTIYLFVRRPQVPSQAKVKENG